MYSRASLKMSASFALGSMLGKGMSMIPPSLICLAASSCSLLHLEEGWFERLMNMVVDVFRICFFDVFLMVPRLTVRTDGVRVIPRFSLTLQLRNKKINESMDKELYQDIISVIDSLIIKTTLIDKDGIKLLGEARWIKVKEWMNENHGKAVGVFSTGLGKRNEAMMIAMKEDCKNKIIAIEKENEMHGLAKKQTRSQILYNRHAVIVSYLSLAIAILATTPLPTLLYKWLWRTVCGWFGFPAE